MAPHHTTVKTVAARQGEEVEPILQLQPALALCMDWEAMCPRNWLPGMAPLRIQLSHDQAKPSQVMG